MNSPEVLEAFNRDALVEILWKENVLARRYFFPGCHRMEPYHASYASEISRLPVAENLVTRTLLLPTGTAVSLETIEAICQILQLVFDRAPQVKARMAGGLVPAG